MADLITDADVTAAVPALATSPDLADLIADASAAVEDYCGREFQGVAAATETYDGTGLARLFLARRPVVAVTAVAIDGTALDNTDGQAWSSDPDTGELRRGPGHSDVAFPARFPAGLRNVSVTYSAGIAVPRPVRRATVLLVKHLADRAARPGAYRSETIGAYGYAIADDPDVPPLVVMLLRKYVRLWVV